MLDVQEKKSFDLLNWHALNSEPFQDYPLQSWPYVMSHQFVLCRPPSSPLSPGGTGCTVFRLMSSQSLKREQGAGFISLVMFAFQGLAVFCSPFCTLCISDALLLVDHFRRHSLNYDT